MNREQLKTHLKRKNFIRSLPYEELKIAHRIIEKGVDYPLLYFWYNLRQLNYWPCFTITDVSIQVLYYVERNPDFEEDILEWFNIYDKATKHLYGGTTNHSKRSAP